MEKQRAVADASVVVKWFIEEDSSDQARYLRDSFVTGKLIVSVPGLLVYETLNALWQSGLFQDEELALAAKALSEYGFDVWEPRGKIMEETAILSAKEGISIYDASYVALALHLDTQLYTADDELIRKFPDIGRQIRTLKLDSGS